MYNNGVYGTQIELQAAATYLQIPIYVHTKPYAVKDWQWTCMTPQILPKDAYTYDSRLKNMPIPSPHTFYLEFRHTNLNHYDCIVPLNLSDTPSPPKLAGDFWSMVIS